MNKFKEHVARRTDKEKRQMIADYEQFVTVGFIGKCKLRSVSREWIDSVGAGNCSITSVMKDIAMECYQYFTMKYFAISDSLTSIVGIANDVANHVLESDPKK